jgi:hypothetical protein
MTDERRGCPSVYQFFFCGDAGAVQHTIVRRIQARENMSIIVHRTNRVKSEVAIVKILTLILTSL